MHATALTLLRSDPAYPECPLLTVAARGRPATFQLSRPAATWVEMLVLPAAGMSARMTGMGATTGPEPGYCKTKQIRRRDPMALRISINAGLVVTNSSDTRYFARLG